MVAKNTSNDNIILRDKIKELRDVSIEMKNSLDKEDYDGMEMFLNKRQEIIDYLMKLEYSKDDFAQLCEEYKIVELQEEIKQRIIIKKDEIKNEIKKLSMSKNAAKSYNKKFAADAIFFNKRI